MKKLLKKIRNLMKNKMNRETNNRINTFHFLIVISLFNRFSFNSVAKALKKGDEVRLVGFGTFGVSKRAATTGRNPRTGETIKIPARKVAKFKPGKALQDSVN